MKKLILLVSLAFTTLSGFTQDAPFPIASNKAWKTSVNTGTTPDTIRVVGTDTVVYQVLTGGWLQGGRMSVVFNALEITDTLSGSVSLEGSNDNTGLSWCRIDGTGRTFDTLAFTNQTLVKKGWDFDADYLKYRVRIQITNDTRFVLRTNSAWKRYYFNGNLNN